MNIPSDRSASTCRGYALTSIPAENKELTHVGLGTPERELIRLYWQPATLESKLGDVPLVVRILGEDGSTIRLC